MRRKGKGVNSTRKNGHNMRTDETQNGDDTTYGGDKIKTVFFISSRSYHSDDIREKRNKSTAHNIARENDDRTHRTTMHPKTRDESYITIKHAHGLKGQN